MRVESGNILFVIVVNIATIESKVNTQMVGFVVFWILQTGEGGCEKGFEQVNIKLNLVKRMIYFAGD